LLPIKIGLLSILHIESPTLDISAIGNRL